MKIEITENEEGRKYPWIGQANNEQIVLFVNNSGGIALNDAIGFKKGEFFEFWNIKSFIPFTGTITLSND